MTKFEAMQSWTEWKLVPVSSIQGRLQSVRPLREEEHEQYELTKDQATGEHYVHYSYMHRNIGAIGTSGQDEIFHQLLPVSSDDVLGILFGEQPYTYPEHWRTSFLRNGPEGEYVWFDPSYVEEEQQYEAVGRTIVDELARFKEQGDLSEEALQRLLDRLLPGDDKK
ncbi:hypothetical protein [Paenibacillus sp. YYML68]|uniref:hypothetical protein n=1 Tax=Paenibacillus sp. YYML68 TaxID=2909250 RepID=UPI0024908FA7|nr:hypothetical protein [Paenibacillus sp. YYML68]